jgi:hypothetical protein
MSKFAMSALVRVRRQENRNLPDLRIHGFCPGAADTPLYANAANYAGWKDRPPPPVLDPAQVAAAIVRTATGGRERDRNVGLANHALVLAFRLVPAVFDTLAGPLVRAMSFTWQPAARRPGNVFDPPPAAPMLGQAPPSRSDTVVDGSSRSAR